MSMKAIREAQRRMMKEHRKAAEELSKVPKNFEKKLSEILVGKKIIIQPEGIEMTVGSVESMYFEGNLPTFRVHNERRTDFRDIGPGIKIKFL